MVAVLKKRIDRVIGQTYLHNGIVKKWVKGGIKSKSNPTGGRWEPKKTPEIIKKKREYDILYRKNNLEKRRQQNAKYYSDPENKKKKAINDKKYYIANREKILQQNLEYNKKNGKEIYQRRKAYSKQYAKNNKESRRKWRIEYEKKNKDRIKKKNKEYQKTNREKINLYHKNRRKKDKEYQILKNLRNRIWYALCGKTKSAATIKLIGCSIEELKTHLQSKWEDWMSWDNYGKGDQTYDDDWWVIDHIKPCATFDMSNLEEQKKCFHFSNLQPLHWLENAKKGDTWIKEESLDDD